MGESPGRPAVLEELLVELRGRMAGASDGTVAQIAREIRIAIAELEAVAALVPSVPDELKGRRSKRSNPRRAKSVGSKQGQNQPKSK